MAEAGQQNWGEPFSGLRLGMRIEPDSTDGRTPRLLSLTIQNSSEAEISFRPFISFQLSGASDDVSFWAPADITMPKTNFPKRSFPQRPNGQPIISLTAGQSKTLGFPLEELGWDTFKSSYYRGQNFYSVVPKGKYELIAAIELWEGQIKQKGQTDKIPKGQPISSGKLHLAVSLQDSRKVIAVEN